MRRLSDRIYIETAGADSSVLASFATKSADGKWYTYDGRVAAAFQAGREIATTQTPEKKTPQTTRYKEPESSKTMVSEVDKFVKAVNKGYIYNYLNLIREYAMQFDRYDEYTVERHIDLHYWTHREATQQVYSRILRRFEKWLRRKRMLGSRASLFGDVTQ